MRVDSFEDSRELHTGNAVTIETVGDLRRLLRELPDRLPVVGRFDGSHGQALAVSVRTGQDAYTWPEAPHFIIAMD